MNPDNPSYAITSMVIIFLQVAGDIYAAVDLFFAKKNAIEISIKNSGYSYSGASTEAVRCFLT
jgi:hypothetical protein